MGVLSVDQQHRVHRPGKRRSRAVIIDRYRFEDRRQANLYLELKAMQRAGSITDLKANVRLPLTVNGIRVDTCSGLFSYREDGRTVLVDSAGWHTEVRRLQRKLAEALYGIKIVER